MCLKVLVCGLSVEECGVLHRLVRQLSLCLKGYSYFTYNAEYYGVKMEANAETKLTLELYLKHSCTQPLLR